MSARVVGPRGRRATAQKLVGEDICTRPRRPRLQPRLLPVVVAEPTRWLPLFRGLHRRGPCRRRTGPTSTPQSFRARATEAKRSMPPSAACVVGFPTTRRRGPTSVRIRIRRPHRPRPGATRATDGGGLLRTDGTRRPSQPCTPPPRSGGRAGLDRPRERPADPRRRRCAAARPGGRGRVSGNACRRLLGGGMSRCTRRSRRRRVLAINRRRRGPDRRRWPASRTRLTTSRPGGTCQRSPTASGLTRPPVPMMPRRVGADHTDHDVDALSLPILDPGCCARAPCPGRAGPHPSSCRPMGARPRHVALRRHRPRGRGRGCPLERRIAVLVAISRWWSTRLSLMGMPCFPSPADLADAGREAALGDPPSRRRTPRTRHPAATIPD